MEPEDRDTAARTLLAACAKLTPQIWYNQKVTSVSHYWAEKGVRLHKEDIVGPKADPDRFLTLQQYESVSKMSMRFYIVAKLPLHNLQLSIAFSGCP